MWEKQMFIAETLDKCLPNAPKDAKLRAVEVDPADAKYVTYLSPSSNKWFLTTFFAIGKTVAYFDDEKKNDIEALAKKTITTAKFQGWTSASKRWDMKARSVHMALMSDTAATRLRKDGMLQAALAEVRRVLKPNGRFLLVLNKDDEKALEGQASEGLAGSLLEKAGLQLCAMMSNDEVSVGFAQKVESAFVQRGKKGFRKVANAPTRPSKSDLRGALGLDEA